MTTETLPSVPVSLPHPNKLLIIEPLDYPNPYDFHHPHRHDYFEIIMVKSGSGKQCIDFAPHPISGGQVFAVYPGQIHLLQRETANGLLIQFRKDIFEFLHPLKHYHLYFTHPAFTPDPETFAHIYELAQNIQALLETEELSALSIHKAYGYLQIILITLAELSCEKTVMHEDHILGQFLSHLTRNIKTTKKVAEYCALIGCSPDRLNTACRSALGKTPLELIHEELILEIRRLLVLSQLSLKEIAFELNFDSPANFSNFIKAQTGMTPSELQASILKIYK
jgi:AraC-like DNA-binding protein